MRKTNEHSITFQLWEVFIVLWVTIYINYYVYVLFVVQHKLFHRRRYWWNPTSNVDVVIMDIGDTSRSSKQERLIICPKRKQNKCDDKNQKIKVSTNLINFLSGLGLVGTVNLAYIGGIFFVNLSSKPFVFLPSWKIMLKHDGHLSKMTWPTIPMKFLRHWLWNSQTRSLISGFYDWNSILN